MREFRGVTPDGLDGRGNYTSGLREQVVFPEVDYDKIDKLRGLEVAIVTTARNDDEARSLLTRLGMPYRKRETDKRNEVREFGEEVFTRALEARPCAPEVQGASPQSMPHLRRAARLP